MNALDRAIAFVAPEWGARRAAARFGLEQLATHADATPSRLDSTPQAPGVSADWSMELGRDRRILVDRVRQLERDNVLACALLDRSVESVVGTGFRYQARTEDPAWNAEAEALVNGYVLESDERGLNTLHEQISLLLRGYLRDGEGGLVKMTSGCLRGLESDEIGTPEGYYRPGKVDGIELDERGRPKTFHVFKPDNRVLYSDRRISGEREQIPAGDVIFVARRTRANQTRGLTAFNGCFWPLEQIKGSLEAVTVSLRMSACLGLVVKKASPTNTTKLTADPNSPTGLRRVLNLAPGGVLQLLPGEDVTPVTPNAPGPFFEAHVRLLVRIAATAFGLPLEVALGDFGPLNLSSARANLQQACRAWRILQQMVERVYDQILYWKLLEWMEAGKLRPRKDWKKRNWVRPGWLILDAKAENEADLMALDGGFETLSEILGRRGTSLEAWLTQRKIETELLKKAGIELAHSALTRDKIAAPTEQKAPAGKKTKKAGKGPEKAQSLEAIKRDPRRFVARAKVIPMEEIDEAGAPIGRLTHETAATRDRTMAICEGMTRAALDMSSAMLEAAKAPVFHFNPTVNVPKPDPVVVNVPKADPVVVTVNVPKPDPVVVNVAPSPAPLVSVNVPKNGPRIGRIVRDKAGKAIGVSIRESKGK